MSENQEEREVWECSNCRHVEHIEAETICWNCGEGEMLYQGKYWFLAAPLTCPTRWEVFKEWLFA